MVSSLLTRRKTTRNLDAKLVSLLWTVRANDSQDEEVLSGHTAVITFERHF
jgi:hypothetical protein